MNPGDIRDAIRKVHPTLIVNAAAYTAVDVAETEIAAAEAIRTNRIIPITSEQYSTPARRPAYSVLSNSALKNRFAVETSDWRVQPHEIFRQVPST